MQAIAITAYGAPQVLQPVAYKRPVLQPGEGLIRVSAAGVNRPDLLQRVGHYAPPPGASVLPGLEVAGELVEGDWQHADNRWRLKKGDRVCALLQGGGYAEFAAAPLAQCLPVPAGWSELEAASLPETYFTVWSNLFDRAQLGATERGQDETLLVQGGSSGIGVAAIQLAHALGHRVFATAGSAAKCLACESLGAERAINYKTEDFVAVTAALTDGRGVDVILDMVGGDYIARELKALAQDGRLALIAFLGGAKANLNLAEILTKRLTLTGSTLRARSTHFKAHIAAQLKERVWPLLEAGKIRPVIDRVFPMTEAASAHAWMEEGRHIGKIMLAW
ncbi:NAD(P)H-quinone oxidoreductase [Mycoavidus sp. B2-EB]|uniref:NAD(P)H-quinone oxidoreductase n=1 Tax=Mycoavidus sp. B2-EB TaxID=2651972 RepID=UPI001626EA62|nr:NAD(P)H-quinone oxidoreductase [Mycoavidus sp. B2-EB]BBO60004.1 oxidoreductase [Mycoavidus sp. B2-EB]